MSVAEMNLVELSRPDIEALLHVLGAVAKLSAHEATPACLFCLSRAAHGEGCIGTEALRLKLAIKEAPTFGVGVAALVEVQDRVNGIVRELQERIVAHSHKHSCPACGRERTCSDPLHELLRTSEALLCETCLPKWG